MFRLHLGSLSVLFTLAAASACSLRSLDYLDGGEEAPIGPASGGADASGGTPAQGGSGETGGSLTGGSAPGGSTSTGGQGGGSPEGGSAGTNEGGTAGQGGTTSGSGGGGTSGKAGNDAGGSSGSSGSSGAGGSSGSSGSCSDCVLEDETPYQLVPSHHLDACIDVQAFSMNRGARAQQYRNYHQANQVFWAEARDDGSFSFRSAHSGKCLEVTDGSLDPGAAVRQWLCTGDARQRWRPVRADDGSFRLVAVHSELVLDVTGAASLENGEIIVQNAPDDLGDSLWRIEPATRGAYVALFENEDSDIRARHVEAEMRAETEDGPDTEWKVVSGLADAACVSFEARDEPGHFIHHENGALTLAAFESSAGFALEATFCFRAGLQGSGWSYLSLESAGHAGYYVMREGDRMVLAALEDTDAFRTAATWYVRQP